MTSCSVSTGDSFRSRRLLHLQCSSSPSWWHRGIFVSQWDFISPLPWPPNSPDLNPVDYEVWGRWGVLQQRVYHSRIRDVDHLTQRLIEECRCFDQNISDRAVRQWHVWLRPYARPCKRRPLWAQTVTDIFVYELLRRLFHIGNLFLSSIFKMAVVQKLCGGFCWNLQRLRRKYDN